MSLSLLTKYFKETGARNIVAKDYGFATYVFQGTNCYIEDVYIDEQHRGKGKTDIIEKEIIKHAKEHGCTGLVGSVIPSYNTSTDSMAFMISRGYRIFSSQENIIYMIKEII